MGIRHPNHPKITIEGDKVSDVNGDGGLMISMLLFNNNSYNLQLYTIYICCFIEMSRSSLCNELYIIYIIIYDTTMYICRFLHSHNNIILFIFKNRKIYYVPIPIDISKNGIHDLTRFLTQLNLIYAIRCSSVVFSAKTCKKRSPYNNHTRVK